MMSPFVMLYWITICWMSLNPTGTCCKSERELTMTPSIENISSNFVEYTVYPNLKLPWQQARSFCRSKGADLAKMKDPIGFIKEMAQQVNSTTEEKAIEFYLSAIKISDDSMLWVSDCKNQSLERRGTSSCEHTNSRCITWKFVQTQKLSGCNACTDKKSFICEVRTEKSCNYTSIIEEQDATIVESNKTECHASCTEDASCWAVITIANQLCIKIHPEGYGAGTIRIERKANCSKYSIDYTRTTGTIDHLAVDDSCLTSPSRSNCCTALKGQPSRIVSSTMKYPQLFTTTVKTTITETTAATITQTVTAQATETVTRTITASPISVSPTATYMRHTSTRKIQDSHSIISATPSSSYIHKGSESIVTTYGHVVDPKSTSKYRRALTSANQYDVTSRCIGYVAIAFVIGPLVILILIDTMTVWKHFRDHESIYNRKPK